MEEKDTTGRSTVSHYFKEDQKSIFDDISEPEPKLLSNTDEQTDFNQSSVFVVDTASSQNESDQNHPSLFTPDTQEPGQGSTIVELPDFTKTVEVRAFKSSSNKLPSYFPSSSSPFCVGHDSSESEAVGEINFDDNISNTILRIGSRHTSFSSNVELTYDAWIPCQTTKEVLNNLSSPPGSYTTDRFLLTMPGVATKEDFGDPIKNLVQTYLGEEAAAKRRLVTSLSVTQDDHGLRQLISSGCYHAAVNLTTQLLTVYGQGEGRAGQPSKHTAHSIQLWFTRLALLVKLRRFSLAEVECEPLGDLDAPDLYFEYYPELYGGRKGSMVPFSFRLIAATLPQYLGRHLHALDRLSKILAVCEKILRNLNKGLSEDGMETFSKGSRDDALEVWKCRRVKVLYAITNCAVTFKDFRLASSLLQTLLQEDPKSVSGLYSALGRLSLLLGDVTTAQDAFQHYLEYSPTGAQHDPVQGLLHSALIACAKNNYQDATHILYQAYKASPTNALVVNNLGVCLMFIGKIRDAITLVEEAVFNHPDKLLHEALVLNLSTMYELESSNAHKKKLNLLSLVANHKGDAFNIAALKLQVA